MSFLPALEEAYKKYFQQILIEQQFELYEKLSQGMGALMSFKNNFLKLQLINDRGLLNLNISAEFEEDFFDAELVNSLLLLEREENLNIGQFSKRQLIMKRLDLEEQAKLIRYNWSKLISLFSRQNIEVTKSKLDKLGLERAEIMLGKNVISSK